MGRWETKMMTEGEELECAAQGRMSARQLNFVFGERGWGWGGGGGGGRGRGGVGAKFH